MNSLGSRLGPSDGPTARERYDVPRRRILTVAMTHSKCANVLRAARSPPDRDQLGYTKLPDGWGLALPTASYWVLDASLGWSEGNQDSVSEIKPLLRATRTIRAEAADRVSDLIEALHESALN